MANTDGFKNQGQRIKARLLKEFKFLLLETGHLTKTELSDLDFLFMDLNIPNALIFLLETPDEKKKKEMVELRRLHDNTLIAFKEETSYTEETRDKKFTALMKGAIDLKSASQTDTNFQSIKNVALLEIGEYIKRTVLESKDIKVELDGDSHFNFQYSDKLLASAFMVLAPQVLPHLTVTEQRRCIGLLLASLGVYESFEEFHSKPTTGNYLSYLVDQVKNAERSTSNKYAKMNQEIKKQVFDTLVKYEFRGYSNVLTNIPGFKEHMIEELMKIGWSKEEILTFFDQK